MKEIPKKFVWFRICNFDCEFILRFQFDWNLILFKFNLNSKLKFESQLSLHIRFLSFEVENAFHLILIIRILDVVFPQTAQINVNIFPPWEKAVSHATIISLNYLRLTIYWSITCYFHFKKFAILARFLWLWKFVASLVGNLCNR